MGIKADHLALQFLFKSGHDRHHQDQHGDPQGDSNHGDQGDHGEEGALRFQITGRQEKRCGQTHAKRCHGIIEAREFKRK